MSQVLGRARCSEEVEQNILLKQVELSQQGGSLYHRSALHSIDMEEIVLAPGPDDSTASTGDRPLQRLLELRGRSAPCRIRCCWNRMVDSAAAFSPRDIGENFAMRV